MLVGIRKNYINVYKPGHPTIRVDDEKLVIDNVQIWTKHHHQQEAISVLACESSTNKLYTGIGCYGFNNESWVGVEEETFNEFCHWLSLVIANELYLIDRAKVWQQRIMTYGKEKFMFFNQGDAYFAAHTNTDAPGTKVGEQPPEPLLLQMARRSSPQGTYTNLTVQ